MKFHKALDEISEECDVFFGHAYLCEDKGEEFLKRIVATATKALGSKTIEDQTKVKVQITINLTYPRDLGDFEYIKEKLQEILDKQDYEIEDISSPIDYEIKELG